MDVSRGLALVLAGLLLLSTTLTVSAVTAPSRTIEASGPATTPTQSTTAATTAGGGAAATDAEPTATQPATPTTANGTATATPTTTVAPTTQFGSRRVLIGIQGGGPKWKKKGSVKLVAGQTVVWQLKNSDSYFDVTRLDNGSVVAGFMHGGYEEGCEPYDPPCTKTGYRIIDPEPTPRVVSEWSFPVRRPANSEVHDVEPLGDGRFLLSDMEYERIMIVEDGEITWQWNGSSFYDAPEDPTRRDWLHINDVDVLAEDHYLISVRNANQLLIVERGEGVVDVINEDRSDENDDACTEGPQLKDFDGDGDIRCGNPEVLNHQHNPQWLGDGAVLVADSDNDRVVELHETDDGRWRATWTLTRAADLPLYWPRDADRLPNGNTLVTDSLHKRVFEVTPNGTVVWSRPTNLIPYEADVLGAGEVAGPYSGAATPTPSPTPTSGANTATTDTRGTTTADGGLPSNSGNDSSLSYGDGDDTGTDTSDGDVPVLSLLLVGIRGVVPRLPFWFGELQLGITLVSLGLVVGGVVDHTRD